MKFSAKTAAGSSFLIAALLFISTILYSQTPQEGAQPGSQNVDAMMEEVEASLVKAYSYDAQNLAADDFNASVDSMVEANASIYFENDAEAKNHVQEAKTRAQAALDKSVSTYASNLKGDAKNELDSAKTALAASKSTNPTYTDYVKAGDEAMTASEKHYGEQLYDESVKDSKEVINLSRVLKEQLGVKTDVAVAGDQKSGTVADGTSGGSASDASQPAVQNASEWKEYTVKRKVPSDCLWRIAAYDFHYGNGKYWRLIYAANKGKIRNPNVIRPGMVLRIPPMPGSGGSTKSEPQPGATQKEESNAKEQNQAVETAAPDPMKEGMGPDTHSPAATDMPPEDNTGKVNPDNAVPANPPAFKAEEAPATNESAPPAVMPEKSATDETPAVNPEEKPAEPANP